MNEPTIDSMTRIAAMAFTRRRSVAAIGGAALATVLTVPRPTQAGKGGKKAKKQIKKTCKRQDSQCAAFFEDFCEGEECEAEELEAALACCAVLRTCDAGEFLACLFDLIGGGESE